ncbi:helix-turn-helix domain-containing protein [Intestinibacter sp.]|uniref:helix-turn-helix domain-containing protein n=1 Tax=Intestinibacter sp. TaxID=1965304 RepID=UPI002A90ED73|nr:helix-turn-helix transcriptional regulator [Intestinibacter sp.]MDY5211800.1 helix-turn-helix transcriptional regulator [Intestinibacter sp.]
MSQLPKVGRNLKRLRKSLGLSLDEASKLTGVSKAMLGQIEREESSPTISTLWRISSGLKINFISLLDDNKSELVLVKK